MSTASLSRRVHPMRTNDRRLDAVFVERGRRRRRLGLASALQRRGADRDDVQPDRGARDEVRHAAGRHDVSVPMWGYALDSNGHRIRSWTRAEAVRPYRPGPRIVVPPGSRDSDIKLDQPAAGADLARDSRPALRRQPGASGSDGRVRVDDATEDGGGERTGRTTPFGPEAGNVPVPERVAPGGPGADGLYGAMTKDAGGRQAYAGSPAVYGSRRPSSCTARSTRRSTRPSANGRRTAPARRSDEHRRLPAVAVPGQRRVVSPRRRQHCRGLGRPGHAAALRSTRACARTRRSARQRQAERSSRRTATSCPTRKDQAGVMLAAGKTHDVLWTPTAAGSYSLYDRMLSLNAARPGRGRNAGEAAGVGGAGTDTSVYANDDSYGTSEGVPSPFPRPASSATTPGPRRRPRSRARRATESCLSPATAGSATRRPRASSASTRSRTRPGGERASASRRRSASRSRSPERAPVALGQQLGATARRA